MNKILLIGFTSLSVFSLTTFQGVRAQTVVGGGDAPLLNINADIDRSANADSPVLFNTTDTTIEVQINNDADLTGNVSAPVIDLSTNADDNATLRILSGSIIQAGNEADLVADSDTSGTGGARGIEGNNNLNLNIFLLNGSQVIGGDGGDGADDSGGSAFDGGDGARGISVGGTSTASISVSGILTGGNAGNGGNSSGGGGNGGSGGDGGRAIQMDNNSTYNINSGAVITGGNAGSGGSGNGGGIDGDGGVGGAGMNVSGTGSVVTMNDGSVRGGDGGNLDGNGGQGIFLNGSAGSNQLNMTGGTIRGGEGGTGDADQNAGNGGAGIQVRSNVAATSTLNISGVGTTITGGNGGNAGNNGFGGAGLNITQGGANITIGNGVEFVGGNGGVNGTGDSVGSGDGILFNGTTLTLNNSGLIVSGNASDVDQGAPDGLELRGGSAHSITNDGIIRTLGGGSAIEVRTDVAIIQNNENGIIEGTLADDDGVGIETDNSGITITTLNNAGIIRAIEERALFVDDNDAIATLTNSGTILNTSSGMNGVDESNAIQIRGAVNTFNNSGLISTETASAISMFDNGIITNFTNTASGTITGTQDAVAFGVVSLNNNGSITNFTNEGTISFDAIGQAAIRFSDDAGTIGFLNNSGTISSGGAGANAIENFQAAGTGGVIRLDNSGTINGNINQTADQAYVINMTGGNINGNIILDSRTSNDLNISGGTITGDVSQGTGAAASTLDITGGNITGSITLGENNGDSVNVNLGLNNTSTIVSTASSTLSGQAPKLIKNGAGTMIFGGDIIDNAPGTNNAELEVNDGIARLTKNTALINGGIDLNAGTLDIQENTVTLRATSEISANSNLEVMLNNTENGKILLDSSVNAAITVNDNANITISDNSVPINGQSYVILDATGAGAGTNLNVTADNVVINENLLRHDFRTEKSNDQLLLVTSLSPANIDPENTAINAIVDDAFQNDTELLGALNSLNTSELNEALGTLGTDQSSGGIVTSSQIQEGAISALSNRVNALENSVGTGVGSGNSPGLLERAEPGFWAQGYGGIADQDDQRGLNGYKATLVGFVLGADAKWDELVGEDITAGLAYVYGGGDVDVNNSQNKTDIVSHHIWAYTSIEANSLRYDLNLNYARNNYRTSRNVLVGNVIRQASGDYYGNQYGANIRISKDFDLPGNLTFSPLIGGRYVYLDIENYSEVGAGDANLHVDDQDYTAAYGVLGASIQKELGSPDDVLVTPKLRASYSYDFIHDDIATNSSFQGGGASFQTRGIQPDRHTGSLGGGIEMLWDGNTAIAFDYDSYFRENYYSHNGMVNFRYNF